MNYSCSNLYSFLQVLKKISEGVREFGLSWRQILQFRQQYVGGVDVTVRHLLFTLRQRLQPQSQSESSHKQVRDQRDIIDYISGHTLSDSVQ